MSIIILTDQAKPLSRPAIRVASPAKLLLLMSALCVFIPLAALALSFATGGLAASSILFVYLSGVLLNTPLLLIGVIVCAGFLSLRQLKRFA